MKTEIKDIVTDYKKLPLKVLENLREVFGKGYEVSFPGEKN
jgi:hypothetical protein